MSVSVNMRVVGGSAPVADYHPGHVYRGETDPEYTLDVPAVVRIQLSPDYSLTLDVGDARLLAYELDRAVYQHDATTAAGPGKGAA